MNCQPAQLWLMQAETLRSKAWPKDLATHVNACAACAKFARDLRDLEEEWQDQTLPARAQKAKLAFLAKLFQPASFRQRLLRFVDQTRQFFRNPVRLAAAAAIFLIGISVVLWMMFFAGSGRQDEINRLAKENEELRKALVVNSSDVVDRLIAWNTEMTNAKGKDERMKILEENIAALRREVQETKLLSAKERELAEELLKNGEWLASHDGDPLAESERVNKLAGKLHDLKDEAATTKNPARELQQHELRFTKFMLYVFRPSMDKVVQMKTPEIKVDPKKKGSGFRPPPKDFQQRWDSISRDYDMLHKKGFGFGRPPFGFKK